VLGALVLLLTLRFSFWCDYFDALKDGFLAIEFLNLIVEYITVFLQCEFFVVTDRRTNNVRTDYLLPFVVELSEVRVL